MKKYLFIVLLVGVGFGQDEYPYFSDPNKQIEFEEKRFYIIEKSGKEINTSGGESYTELANSLGYLLLDESPQYVVKQTPIKTHYTYFYDFKIKRGTQIHNELEFLILAGYESKAKQIYSIYQKNLEPYYKHLEEYEKKLEYFNQNNKIIISKEEIWDESPAGCYNQVLGGYTCLSWIFLVWALVDPDINNYNDYLRVSVILTLMNKFQFEKTVKKNSLILPKKPIEPTLKQVLSNEQIKSLAEAYNRRLYQDIQSN